MVGHHLVGPRRAARRARDRRAPRRSPRRRARARSAPTRPREAAQAAQDRALAQIAAQRRRPRRSSSASRGRSTPSWRRVRGDQRARLAARAHRARRLPGAPARARRRWPSRSPRRSAMPCARSPRACRATAPASPSRVLDGPIDETPRGPRRPRRPPGGRRGRARATPTAEHGTAIASLAAGGAGPAGLRGVAAGRADPRDPRPHARCATARWPARPPTSWPASSRPPTPTATATSPITRASRSPPSRRRSPASTTRPRRARSPRSTRSAPSSSRRPATTARRARRYGSLSSPGGAPDALTVGASDGRPALPEVVAPVRAARSPSTSAAAALAGALAPPGRPDAAREGRSPAPRATTRTAGAPASDYQGPDGASLVAGAAVLVPRDGGDLRAKARQAAAQGAAAVLLYGTAELPAGALGGDDRVGIPVLGHRRRARPAHRPGRRRRPARDRSPPAPPTYAPNALRDAVAPFSSEGLGWDDRLKPDVVLPGVAIIGAEAGGGYARRLRHQRRGCAGGRPDAPCSPRSIPTGAPRGCARRSISTGRAGARARRAARTGAGAGRRAPERRHRVAPSTVATSPSTLSLGRPGADGVAHGTLTVENLTDAARTLALGLQRDAAGDATGLDRGDRPGPVRARAARRSPRFRWPCGSPTPAGRRRRRRRLDRRSRPTPAPPSTCRSPSPCPGPTWCRSAPRR